MGEPVMHGLMMDDYPLSLTALIERAELLTPGRKVVYRRPDGKVHRTTMGDCARRARRLATALSRLGIKEGDRVGTLMWNQPEHLETYYAVPSMGAVVHTLNPRLHPDELGFIAADAEDRAIIVDETLIPVLESFRNNHDFGHTIVVSHSGDTPDDAIDYEALIEDAEPMSWPEPHERRAAAICYTSGTTGRPKGVLYSHRALVLHSMGAALPDAMNISARDVGAAGRADVPRERLGDPLHGDHDGRLARAARPNARRRIRARPSGRGEGDVHRRRADRVDGDAEGDRRQSPTGGT